MELRPGLELLAQAARVLHVDTDFDRLMVWTSEAARTATGAPYGGTWIPASGWTTAPVGAAQEIGLSRLGDLAAASSLGLRRVLRLGGLLTVADLNGDSQDARELAPLLRGLSSIIVAAVPIRTGNGVLAVASSAPGHFSAESAMLIQALAEHLGVALENMEQRRELERARATQRQVVDQLQEAVVPARPDVPWTELGAFYSPADPATYTGGDLHDWIVLPNGDLHIAIVDVMGKGVAATKDALAVTHVLRLLVIDGCPLEQVVRRADAIVTAQNPELVATLLVGAYRPTTGCLRLAGGGHPPALLVRNGKAMPLIAPGVPIGWPGAGSEGLLEIELHRSDTVILYTDGLVEADKDIVEGLASLARYAEETAEYPAQQQARVLIDRVLAGAARRDDSLALILRCRGTTSAASAHVLPPFEHRLSRSTAAVPVCRGLIKEWLVRVPVEPAAVHDLLLVATELCANAVEHARWTGTGVVIRARVEDDDIVIEVEDDGAGLTWPYFGAEPPDPSAEAGRGLWLVQAFCDDVSQLVSDTGTVVRCVKASVVLGTDSDSGGMEAAPG